MKKHPKCQKYGDDDGDDDDNGDDSPDDDDDGEEKSVVAVHGGGCDETARRQAEIVKLRTSLDAALRMRERMKET